MIKVWNDWDFPKYIVVCKDRNSDKGFVVCAMSTTKEEAEQYLDECVADDKERGCKPGIYKIMEA